MIQNHSQWMSTEIIAKCAALIVIALASDAAATPPAPIETQVLGVFTGEGAKLHPANIEPNPIRYYGTDLGFTYEHKGKLVILFGDTMATESGDNIDNGTPPVQDDAYGSIALSDWGEPETIAPGNIPLILLGQIDGSSQMATIDPGVPMEGFKTPVGGYSNGDSEFGVFYTGKPLGCLEDADCESGLSCDAGLGYAGQPYFQGEGQTIPCLDGSSPACIPDTMTNAAGEAISGSGFCSDTGSTIWAEEGFGRIAAVGVTHLIGRRSEDNPGRYIEARKWVTNRFLNPSVRTVRDFDPTRGSPGQDYRPASGGGGNSAVFIWGRPAFVGVAAHDRPAGAYFAYAELGEGTDGMGQLNYFSGLDASGKPRFSPNEQYALALDLESSTPGVQPSEHHDVVDQVSVAWVEPLGKWLMFYGGGMTNLPYPPYLPNCGVLEFFTGDECADVVIGDGAFYMRTADNPWGPWTPPAKLIAGGDPEVAKSGQYAPGGMLRHPACNDPTCAPHTAARDINPGEYGFFYSANIIEQWTHKADQGVAVIWNASTWDPYRVILLRTVISP
jgi:hypothetical protein